MLLVGSLVHQQHQAESSRAAVLLSFGDPNTKPQNAPIGMQLADVVKTITPAAGERRQRGDGNQLGREPISLPGARLARVRYCPDSGPHCQFYEMGKLLK